MWRFIKRMKEGMRVCRENEVRDLQENYKSGFYLSLPTIFSLYQIYLPRYRSIRPVFSPGTFFKNLISRGSPHNFLQVAFSKNQKPSFSTVSLYQFSPEDKNLVSRGCPHNFSLLNIFSWEIARVLKKAYPLCLPKIFFLYLGTLKNKQL